MNNIDNGTLFTIVKQHDELMSILSFIQGYHHLNIYIGAGLIRNITWAYLHDIDISIESSDIDLVYFDSEDHNLMQYQSFTEHLQLQFPNIQWDITNQANVHQWYDKYFSKKIEAFSCLEEAIATWPETATAVAIKLNNNNELDIIAPFGLADLLQMIIRWNPTLVDYAYYKKRIQQKQYSAQWPKVKIIY
ncbi:nucleotidyltransferase family protein [Wohlfahrtiimonas populi]|uniref:nucleotidyltransferase family protein n=1 Tax=Wohlfahrtiimonas populi TaxID=1940240 RepID=UPI00098D5C25|nr:nucleotidyltransferase family protein [Wohlfahrtiimonas populi]